MLVKELAALLALGLTVAQLGACGDDDKKLNRELGTDVGHGQNGDRNGDEASGGFRDLDGGLDVAPRDAAVFDAAPPVHCDVTDPQLGCGLANDGWVRFDRGTQIDKTTGLGWVQVQLTDAELRNTDPDDALEKKCRVLQVPGLGKLRIPEIVDVRTLAAGCAATEPNGRCQVKEDRADQAEATSCRCDPQPARGPHPSGGFCRPEVPECQTLWVATFCNPHDCISHTHWFYDPKTGAVVLGDYHSEPAKQAQFYCVTAEPVAGYARDAGAGQ
jgi:hypothetical protein